MSEVVCIGTSEWTSWVALTAPDTSGTAVNPADALLFDEAVARCDCVLLEARPDGPVDSIAIARRIRRVRDSVPLIAVVPLVPASVQLTAAHTRAGVDDVVIFGTSDLAVRIREVTRKTSLRQVAHAAFAAIREVIPAGTHDIVACCLDAGATPCSVEELATRDLGMHRRTLLKRLRAGGLPSPSELLCWTRLVYVVAHLRDHRRSVEYVALTLGFGSGTALRNMLRRHAGLRPSDVRGSAGLDLFLGRFRERLTAGSRPAH